MSSFSITGTVVSVGHTEKKTETFSIRQLVLCRKDGKFEQYNVFEAINDRADLLHGLMEGEEVTVHFDLRGRQWENKTFNQLVIWKVEQQAAPASSTPAAPRTAPKPADADVPWEDAATGELPF
jgi:hypothetical protein